LGLGEDGLETLVLADNGLTDLSERIGGLKKLPDSILLSSRVPRPPCRYASIILPSDDARLLTELSNVVAYPCRHSRTEDRQMATPGQPTSYKPEYGELAHNHSLLGATNETLACSR
jgi:hypothetical protein